MKMKNIRSCYPAFFLPLIVLLIQCVSVDAVAGFGESERLRLIKSLSPAVVGVNSTVIKSGQVTASAMDKGSGSGFVVDSKGNVVTLGRVIADRHNVEVVLWDGTTWPAIFRGEDSETGIALLSVQAPEKVLRSLRGVRFAGDAVTGQDVIAMGRVAGGEMLMVSQALVSCAKRTLVTVNGSLLYDVVQTDRPLVKVMDGGPMFDNQGRVIAMSASLFIKDGESPSGYGIPAPTVRWVVEGLIEKGVVERAWLGAGLVSITPSLSSFLGLPVSNGALITEVVPGGPAEKAGLKGSEKSLCLGNRVYPVGGDIIVGLGKSQIRSDADVIRKLKQFKPGDTTLITIYRGSRLMKLKIKLGRRK